MGGKSSTTTQQVQIPPEVMARYRSVNQRAETVGGTPFQQYGTSASDFVAPINPTQQAGIQGIGNVQNAALPFYGAGAQMTMGGAQGVGPVSGQDIDRYMSPYLGNVVGTTLANLSQEQGIQRQQQIGDSIKAGAFGGDRAGLAAANLARQQGMAYGSTAANLLNQGYGQALGAAQAYQGVEANNLARQLQAGQQIAGLGTGLTNTQIGAGQALLNAGTAEQQTEQAGKSALFNQFQQERSYPFQVAQFLANIAMGTGALSGSTTTTTQPVPFFSDPRLKENMREIGQTHDGMPLYAFNYKGRPGETQIGLNADEVEQMKPEAVGLAGGYKTVDYDAATRPRGGLDPASSMGGAVVDLEPHEYRENFAAGGAPDFASSLAQLYAQFGSPQGAQPGGGLAGPYGGKASYVPSANLPVGQLKTAGSPPPAPGSMANQAMNAAGGVRDFGKTANELYEMGGKGLGVVRSATRQGPSTAAPAAPSAAAPPAASLPPVEYDPENRMRQARGGLVGYADGGDVEDPMKSYGAPQGGLDIPTEQPDIKPLNTPTGMPGAPKSGMSDVMDVAKFAASLFAMSDERVKDGMQRVGQLDNGLPVYKYSIGDGPTQIGLSAQEASGLHPGAAMADDRGILHLDYDRATRAYGGGLDPRAGYADGGGMSDDEYAIRTIATEASGKSPEEARAIARVIENRRATGRWGDSYRDVVTARNQFEPWNNPGGVNYPMRIRADDPRLAMAREAFATRLEGEDPTGGALHFYAPTAQAQLARTRGDRAAVPSWARDREYTDLGPTRFVRGVDDPRASGLMAYAGQPQRAEASGVIDQAAGRPAGLGAATTTAPRQKGFVENLLPTKRDPRTGEETTDWKKIIIPALTGLGAMASSPSLYAGSAILQGLGAGAQAYSGLEKREADIAGTEAQTFETTQRANNASIFNDGKITWVRLANGQPVPIWEWIKTRQPVLGGQLGMAAAERAAERYVTSEGRSTDATSPALRASPASGAPTGPAAPAAPAAPSEPGSPVASPGTSAGSDAAPQAATYTPFGRASQAAAEKDVEATLGPNSEGVRADSAAYLRSTRSQGDAAREAGAPLFETALNVSKTVAGKGFDAPGAAYPARAQLASAANTLARAFGYTGQPFSATDTQQALQNKFNNVQALAMARGGGQESLGALQSMIESLPRTDMPPDAQAQVTANLLMLNQQSKDRDAHRIQYGEKSLQSFVSAGDAFRKDNPEGRYTQEVDLLKTVIRNDPKAIEMLIGGRATAPQVEEYFKTLAARMGKPYIPGISRYFIKTGG